LKFVQVGLSKFQIKSFDKNQFKSQKDIRGSNILYSPSSNRLIKPVSPKV